MMTTGIPKWLALAMMLAAPLMLHAEEVVEIEIREYRFIPEQVSIKPGTRVRWINKEKRQFHNVWFREAGEEPGEYLFPGDSFERVFSEAGDYPYVCQPHESRMQGRIRVTD
jgi:plastocyanin